MTSEQLDNWFSHHPASPDNLIAYAHIRRFARDFAEAINQLCPESADKSHSIRLIRDAMMWANASIACEGK